MFSPPSYSSRERWLVPFYGRLAFPSSLVCVCLLSLLIIPSSVNSRTDDIAVAEAHEVKAWAAHFGKDIKDGSTEATCLRKITENYNENMGAKVEWVDATKMLEEMRIDVQNMLNWKKEAVARIAVEAEKLASNHSYDKHLKFRYINAKRIYDPRFEAARVNSTPMTLSNHPNFENVRVNTAHSTVHVPINVYGKGSDVVNHVKWSEGLTQVFKNNLAFDPYLSWQFFGSNTGFMRIWPAAKWRVPIFVREGAILKQQPHHDQMPGYEGHNRETDGLDLYDSRMRSWFIQGASSPKDMLILLDGSGSMTGQRKDIAKNVVLNILDTLTDDDYFNVVRFTDILEPVVECFGLDDLVPASKQNIREFKERLDGLNTSEIANFTQALTHAFETLNRYAKSKEASQCNQAIMLVTDGAPANFESIFKKYNWPRIPVRMFTYLVGREVTETMEVNWMACHNRGYYTHVANLAEVREQVQLYIPVMSRPIVLAGKRPFVWTPVYADVTEIPLTNWVWEERQREKIRAAIRTKIEARIQREANDQYYEHGKGETDVSKAKEDENAGEDDDGEDEEETDYEDPSEKSKNLSRLAIEGSSELKPKVKRSSGKNVKQALVPPTVSSSASDTVDLNNGTKDGKDDKKPKTKKSVSVFEYPMVETLAFPEETIHLMTTVAAPVFDVKNSTIITVRVLVKNVWEEQQREIRTANLLGVAGIDVPIKEIVKLTPAHKLGVNGYSFAVTNNGFMLYHPDLRPIFQDMLKPFYSSVDLSEVELADNSLPAREPDPGIEALRKNMIDRVIGWKKMDVKMHLDGMKRVITRTNSYYYGPIEGTPFSLAISLPEPYGHYRVDGQIEVKRRDENYTHFFKGANWRVHPDWVYCANPTNTASGIFQTPEEAIRVFLEQAMKSAASIRWSTASIRPHVYEQLSCEKDLVQSLVFDAKATDIDPFKCGPPKTPSKYERDITKIYGITLTFVATRSGLTRFEDHRTEEEKANSSANANERPFNEVHVRATDELFYKRAVDFHKVNSSAFVFSVPFDAATRDKVYVTAAHAVFIGSGKQQAPVAVIGLQYRHKKFAERFFNATTKCNSKECRVKCADETTECFLLDNNGYIIVAKDDRFTGKFFGEFDEQLFDVLVARNVYKKSHMFDYQGICVDFYQVSGPASFLLTPFDLLRKAIMYLWAKVSISMVDFYINGFTTAWLPVSSAQETEEYAEGEDYPSNFEPDEGRRIINKTKPRPCDKEFDLYEMNLSPDSGGGDAPITGTHSKCSLSGCDQTYIAQPVPYTNLLTVVVLNTCTCGGSTRKVEPTPIDYGGDCDIIRREKYRQRPDQCISNHPEEENIKICGKGAVHSASVFITLLTLTSVTVFQVIFLRHV